MQASSILIATIYVGLGGVLGAVSRFALVSFTHRFLSLVFPYGTLLVNVLGSFLIGAMMCLFEAKAAFGTEVPPQARMFFVVGFLGSLTTFSTIAFDTFSFLRQESYLSASLNLGANVFFGVLAVMFGWFLMKWMIAA